jgi:MYXO-CTERM domain-containing protein
MNTSFASLRLLLSALSLAGATLTASSAAFALDCKADADCGQGFFCELAPTVSTSPGCAPGANCTTPEPAPAAATTGTCQASPLSCASDADCPEYLTCASSGDYACAAPSCPAGQNCPAPDCTPPANAPKTCQVRSRTCQADADCYGNFQCVITQGGVACATPACPPGAPDCPATDCPAPGTPAPSQGYCEPKEITCAADSDCPTDWACVEFDETTCSGSAGTTTPPSMGTGPASSASGGMATPPAPPPPTPPSGGGTGTSGSGGTGTSGTGTGTSDPGTSCTQKVTRLCAPKGYVAASGGRATDLASPEVAGSTGGGATKGHQGSSASAVGAPGASGAGSAGTNAASGSTGSDDSGSGCSVGGAGRSGGSGAFALAAVGLAAWLVRRRRA